MIKSYDADGNKVFCNEYRQPAVTATITEAAKFLATGLLILAVATALLLAG